MLIIIFLVYLMHVNGGNALSGHVCKRERAETYLTSYNQAFLCQERYTTSCGHLDWRRCTRYRVQTCFTPRQRYAIRYHEDEVCCPGWREDGSGVCVIAVCSAPCQNGGRCGDIGGTSGCVCKDGYSGELCQHEVSEVEGWKTALLCACAGLTVIVIGVAFYIRHKYRKKKKIAPAVRVIPPPSTVSRAALQQCQSFCHRTPNGYIRDDCCSNHSPSQQIYPSAPVDYSET